MGAIATTRRRFLQVARDAVALLVGRVLLRACPGLVNAAYDRLPHRWLKFAVSHRVFGSPSRAFPWRVTLPQGATLSIDVEPGDPYSLDYAFAFKVHDVGVRNVQQLLFERAGPGTLYLDVGANVGTTAVYALSRRLPCWLFEPNRSLEAFATRLFARNGYATARWLPVALSDRRGEETLHVSPSSYLSSFDAAHAAREGPSGTMQVPLRPLDDYLGEIRGCADDVIVKIDVEGHELNVLRGAAGVLAELRPPVIVEVFAPARAAIWDFMQAAGYSAFGILDEATLATVAARTAGEMARCATDNFVFLPQGHWALARLVSAPATPPGG